MNENSYATTVVSIGISLKLGVYDCNIVLYPSYELIGQLHGIPWPIKHMWANLGFTHMFRPLHPFFMEIIISSVWHGFNPAAGSINPGLSCSARISQTNNKLFGLNNPGLTRCYAHPLLKQPLPSTWIILRQPYQFHDTVSTSFRWLETQLFFFYTTIYIYYVSHLPGDRIHKSCLSPSILLLLLPSCLLHPPPCQPRAPDLSGHCRTSTASCTSQWALPDLNCESQLQAPDLMPGLNSELQISVGTAGPEQQAPDLSCRTSTASCRSQWALPKNLNRELQISVGCLDLNHERRALPDVRQISLGGRCPLRSDARCFQVRHCPCERECQNRLDAR